MTTDDPAVWMALGAALAGKEHLARLLALAPARDWGDPRVRRLVEAMAQGRVPLAAALAAVGVPLPDGRKAAEAVLDAAEQRLLKRKQQTMAGRLETASRLLPPEAFRAFLLREAESLAGREDAGQAAG